jgi:exonuclease SbcD
MRILLSSDWHLGKNILQKKLLSEQALFFENSLIPLLREVRPDLFIVAGDILDKPLPDQETLFFYEDLLRRLSDLKIPTLFILGNHDSRRTSLHNFFIEKAGLYLVDDLRFLLQPFVCQGKRGEKLNLYLLPYLPLYELLDKALNLGFSFSSEELTFIGLVEELLSQIEIKGPAFLVSHFAVDKAIFCGEELLIRGYASEYLLPESLFSSFEALFLGHLHRHQVYGERFFYPGAPLPYAFETYAEKRGLLLLEWRDSALASEFIALSPPYELKVFKGLFEELLQMERTNAYVRVLLEDPLPIYGAYEKLKETFPNLLDLKYVEEEAPEFQIEERLGENLREARLDEGALFREFYSFIEKKEIDECLWEVFEKHLKAFYKKEREEGRLCQ